RNEAGRRQRVQRDVARQIELAEALRCEDAGAMHGAAERSVLLAEHHAMATARDLPGGVQPCWPPPDDEDVHAGLWHVRSHYKHVLTPATLWARAIPTPRAR